MVSLSQIETDLVAALKARNQVAADTLRALKTRIQNEQIAKMKILEEADVLSLIQSEVKKRKEAADSFAQGGRVALAEKEMAEAAVLSGYLPAQASEADIATYVDSLIETHSFKSQDFGKIMAELKKHFGPASDGSTLSRIVKEKLK